MSTIFDEGAHTPFLDEDPYKRFRGLHPNCFAAARCSSPFRASVSSTSTPCKSNTPFSTPPSHAGTDYFSLGFSPPSTPLSLSTPLSTPASRCTSPIPESLYPPQPQTPSPTNVKLLPFTKEDTEATASLFERAFEHDGIRRAVMPPDNLNPEDPLEERRWRVRLYEKALEIPSHRVVKAVDEAAGGRIVGAAGYFGPGGLQWEEDGEAKEALPSHWDLEMQNVVIGIVKEKRACVLKEDYNVWELAQMFVDPEYQRKGIGKMLLAWGIKQADDEGLPIYLEGTLAGRGLYEQVGFTVEDETEFPGVCQDGKEYKMYFMVRQPGASRPM